MKRKKTGSRVIKIVLRLVAILFVTLCLLEWMYRDQWFDFYKSEWSFQNGNLQSDPSNKRILVLGDSFSADSKSWVSQWKEKDTLQIFNGAVPGIGPETFRLILSRRLEQCNPNVLIVQLYEGNDLIDIRKPVNWKTYSFARNIFWSLGNTFRCLNFINYRLGQSAGDVKSPVDPKTDSIFSPGHYSQRTRLYIAGDETYPASHIRLVGEKLETFKEMCEMLNEMRSEAGSQIRFILLTVPHCVQVADEYHEHYEQMGAKTPGIVLFGHSWAEELKKAGFEVWDPLPAMRIAEKKGMKLYYANDPHLNEKGQRLLAEFVKNEWRNHVQ